MHGGVESFHFVCVYVWVGGEGVILCVCECVSSTLKRGVGSRRGLLRA